MSPKSAALDFQSDRRRVLACFEAYLGCFGILYVPETLHFEPFWDPKRVDSGGKVHFSDCALGPTEVPNHMFLAHVVAIFD